jgi:hypothetical protein
MLRAVFRLLIPCLSLVVSLTALTHQAGACSGPGPRIQLDTVVVEADAVIYGRVIEADDVGQNVIVRVNTYLNGKAGPRNILVSLWPPPSVFNSRDFQYSGGCFYIGAPLSVGDNIVMFLDRNVDGSYSKALGLFGAGLSSYGELARFPARDTRVHINYFTEPEGDERSFREVTRDELFGLLFSVPGAYPAKPIDEAPYPLEAPLLLIDDEGKHYLLPIDGGPPVEMVGEDFISLRRYKLACWWVEICRAWAHTGTNAAEKSAVFSPTGDTYAQWTEIDGETVITVYNTIGRTSWWQFSNINVLPTPAFRALYVGHLTLLRDLGAWSPDGRVLAFVDDRGLWLWDPFAPDATPELQTQKNITAVHGFSRTGRYLSVTVSGERKHLDLISGEYLPDGALSAEDRTLLVYGSPPHMLHLVPRNEFPFPPDIYGMASIIKAEWTARWRFAALMCGDETRESCAVIELSRDKLSEPAVHTGYAFDYSQDTGSLAVVKNPRMLSLRNGLNGEMREVDLSGLIGGEIAEVEWLPSLFYHEAHEGGLP